MTKHVHPRTSHVHRGARIRDSRQVSSVGPKALKEIRGKDEVALMHMGAYGDALPEGSRRTSRRAVASVHDR